MKVSPLILILSFLLLFAGCDRPESAPPPAAPSASSYLDYSGYDDLLSGGIKMIPISTPKGEFKVWTKRVGHNPRIKVLLLHGGPGLTHEVFECFDSYFPRADIQYYYYDQLGSYYSDQPKDSTLWDLGRFVEEVEQVRQALGLDSSNFYLYGQSWGGLLGIEYALKYQQHLKGLVISNMMASIPAYSKYAEEVLGPQLDPAVLKEIKALEAAGDFANPRYMELVTGHYYPEHVLRKPMDQWPDPVDRSGKHINPDVYIPMQGHSEFGVTPGALLEDWDRTADLPKIKVPTLSIGGAYDTMDPEHMKWMAGQVQKGRYLHCPQGSHLAMYDDQVTYFEGLIRFIKDVDKGRF